MRGWDNANQRLSVRLFFPSTLLAIVVLCGCDTRKDTLPPEKVAALAKSLVQAPIPTGATNIYGYTASVFTTVINVRFECSSEELKSFLVASPVLQDDLVPGKRAVKNSMCQQSWWQPDSLESVSGSDQEWRSANGKVFAQLMSGSLSPSGKVIAYISMTIE